jgi:hypothetical protein
MRVEIDADALAKYQAALATEERLKSMPDNQRDAEAIRSAILATRGAFAEISRGRSEAMIATSDPSAIEDTEGVCAHTNGSAQAPGRGQPT